MPGTIIKVDEKGGTKKETIKDIFNDVPVSQCSDVCNSRMLHHLLLLGQRRRRTIGREPNDYCISFGWALLVPCAPARSVASIVANETKGKINKLKYKL